MSNRTGKREREARNRHKRCMATVRIGGEWQTLKLGRKKAQALMLSLVCDRGEIQSYDYLSPRHNMDVRAVPVADSRTPAKTDEGDANVSEQVSSPARRKDKEFPQ